MRFRPIRSGTCALAVLGIALTGCIADGPDPVAPSAPPRTSVRPGPSGSIGPNPSLTPTPRPTPTPIPPIEQRGPGFEPPRSAPSIEVAPGVRTAVAEVDGVRITIEAAGNPLVVGEPVWITTTLRNTGRDGIGWITDGCLIHIGTHGEMPFRWAGGFVQSGSAKTFKEWAYVANLPPIDSPIWLEAVAERFVGREHFGCADLGVPHEPAPGRQIRERHRWDGQAALDMGLPPSGPAEWIAEIQDWDMPITTRFDVPSGLWQIGLKTEDGFSVIVHIDPLTGALIRVVETP